VLLELKEFVSTILVLLLVVISILLYPVVAQVAKRLSGGRVLLLVAFGIEAGVFVFVSLMGKVKTASMAQAIVPIVVFTVPYSILTTMFAWVTADIAEHHALQTGEAVAGMFYAARTFFQKLASTVAVILFALLLQLGKDVGDDLGVRLSGVVGAGLAVLAATVLWFYDEKHMQKELQEMLVAKQDVEIGEVSTRDMTE
jgi:glycoside/pentoside/hexuronide:cation symporter, GPH family